MESDSSLVTGEGSSGFEPRRAHRLPALLPVECSSHGPHPRSSLHSQIAQPRHETAHLLVRAGPSFASVRPHWPGKLRANLIFWLIALGCGRSPRRRRRVIASSRCHPEGTGTTPELLHPTPTEVPSSYSISATGMPQ